MGEQLTEDQTMELVRAQYPEFLAILSKPGVQAALFSAVQNNWTPPRLQAALQATEYYRTTSSDDRAFDILSTVDPQTAQQRLAVATKKLGEFEAQTGIQLQGTEGGTIGGQLIHMAVARNWSDSDFKSYLVAMGANNGEIGPATGELASQLSNVHTLASQYGVPISDPATLNWANQLTGGSVNADAVKGYMIAQAKSMYPNDPNLLQALDQGQTVAQYADPYKQVAVRELNINPGDFNLMDPKWQSALSTVDPKTGNKVPQSLDQWQTTIRTDPRYNYDMTQGAQSQAAALTTALAQKMGAI